MKKLAKNIVARILGRQVRALRKNNHFKIIGVVGSIGKTSTKLAIANVLKAGFKVQYQEGNYNDVVTVPLVFFGEQLPSLFNPLAWLAVFQRNRKQLRQPYQYDVVVLELGSDGPGQIKRFNKYLNLDIAVITSITPEHMAFFGSLDEVAKEELAVGRFSSQVLANKDLCDEKYLSGINGLMTYGMNTAADYKLSVNDDRYVINAGKKIILEGKNTHNQPQLYSLLAAVSVANKLGMTGKDTKAGLDNIHPVSGRMQTLEGVNNSTIIDDTYNASPEAVKLALNTLYETQAVQKIAVLGNMNELGKFAIQAHEEIGNYCDPNQLELVVTIGPEANKYLAPAARAKGCEVKEFNSPYDAGEYLKPMLKENGLVLVKGSQNNVFAEETVKLLLANPADSEKLVRQTENWMTVKNKAFNR